MRYCRPVLRNDEGPASQCFQGIRGLHGGSDGGVWLQDIVDACHRTSWPDGAGACGCLGTSWTVAKYEVLIKAVTVQGLSYRQVAARYGVSKSLVHKLHRRWLTEGDSAFEPQSRRPHASPNPGDRPGPDRRIAGRAGR